HAAWWDSSLVQCNVDFPQAAVDVADIDPVEVTIVVIVHGCGPRGHWREVDHVTGTVFSADALVNDRSSLDVDHVERTAASLRNHRRRRTPTSRSRRTHSVSRLESRIETAAEDGHVAVFGCTCVVDPDASHHGLRPGLADLRRIRHVHA